MNRYRYCIVYHNPWGPHRLAPFIVWAESEELALAYAAQWVGEPRAAELACAYYYPSSAMLDA